MTSWSITTHKWRQHLWSIIVDRISFSSVLFFSLSRKSHDVDSKIHRRVSRLIYEIRRENKNLKFSFRDCIRVALSISHVQNISFPSLWLTDISLETKEMFANFIIVANDAMKFQIYEFLFFFSICHLVGFYYTILVCMYVVRSCRFKKKILIINVYGLITHFGKKNTQKSNRTA